MHEIGAQLYSPKTVAKRFLRSLQDTRDFDTAFWCLFTNSLYRAPRDGARRPEKKFWYLSRKAWPVISLYEKLERQVRGRVTLRWNPRRRAADAAAPSQRSKPASTGSKADPPLGV
jgi:hypothetical protein